MSSAFVAGEEMRSISRSTPSAVTVKASTTAAGRNSTARSKSSLKVTETEVPLVATAALSGRGAVMSTVELLVTAKSVKLATSFPASSSSASAPASVLS